VGRGRPLVRLWLHNISMSKRKGLLKAYCVCGAQSGWVSLEEAQAWTSDHTQIKERKEQARKPGRTLGNPFVEPGR
jgi:hypothetical protein